MKFRHLFRQVDRRTSTSRTLFKHRCKTLPTTEDQNRDRDSEITFMADWLKDPLFPVTKEIWDSFRSRVLPKSKSATRLVRSAADIECLNFFSPSNLRSFHDYFLAQMESPLPHLTQTHVRLHTYPRSSHPLRVPHRRMHDFPSR